jgi:hypothetical protein
LEQISTSSNAQSVSFMDRMLTANSALPSVRSIQRPTFSTSATFAATLRLTTAEARTTIACIAMTERAPQVTNVRAKMIVH